MNNLGSNFFSHRLTTTVITAFPMKFVTERHSDINLSTPNIKVMPAIGNDGTKVMVAARVIKADPVTPAAPFDDTIAIKRRES